MKSHELAKQLHKQFLKLRAVLRFVEGRRFQSAFDRASATDQWIAWERALDLDKAALVRWTQEHLQNDLDFLSIKTLRQIARQLKIYCHKNATREMLIVQIRRAQEGH